MILLVASAWGAETALVSAGSTWSYLDTGVAPAPAWTTEAYDDAAWATGAAPLGYGFVAGLVTTVGYGPDPLNRYVTTWFRQRFTVADLDAFDAFSLHVRRDDGVVVYVNGVEVFRDNLPAGPITASTLALRSLYGTDQDVFLDAILPDGVLVEGDNVVAVEVHQQSPISNDLALDLRLSGWDGPSAITRGPWIQSLGPHDAIVRWRTDGPSASRLSWGTAIGALTSSADDPALAFDHELAVSGVAANTVITYAVGTPDGLVLAGDDADHRFRTAPNPGVARPTRIWVLGDSGTANVNAEAVRDAYAAYSPDPLDTDVWLMLGDNAYPTGTLTDYDRAVFQFYPEWLRQLSLWPVLGNHDGYSSFSDTQSGPYFDLFTLPDEGEAGGEPSGTEAYWSFDHGNIHFVALDSYHSDRAPGSPMLTWLEADLAAAEGTADWLVAFWHHPPYSHGSHNSDLELEMVEMRENVVPILEDHGVDLVLTGHSHDYERSVLMDGHYDVSATWDPVVMGLQERAGDPAADGPYTKWPSALSPHQGAVYVVEGASGQVSGGALDHPAMQVSMSTLGSLVIDIDGLDLEARYLDSTGAVVDTFGISKGVTTIVELTGDPIGTEAELLDFQGLAYQPDGTEVPSYSWDWGDGTPATAGAAASHAWAVEGTYTVTLSATDSDGYVATDTLRVDIDNGPPAIDQLEATPGAVEGAPVTFTGHAVDPGGDPVTYEWEIEGVVVAGDVVDHAFSDDGDFDVTLTVRDDAGREVSAVLPVSVANAPPVARGFSVQDGLEGALATLVAEVDDPGAADVLTGEWEVDGVELGGLYATHTFAASGAYPFTLTVRDDEGAEDVLTGVIDIANVAPVVETTAFDGPLVEGGALTFTATASDVGGDPIQISWDFGDGSGWIAGDRVEHVYADQGPWRVFVAAEDGEGGLGLGAIDVVLANVPPTIDGIVGPRVVDEGADTLWRVAAHDPGVGDVLTARWSFGGDAAEGLSVLHAFVGEGPRTVSVDLTDDEGEGASASIEVTVRNAAPVFESEPDRLVAPGGALVYAPKVRDPDPFTLTLLGPADATLDDGVVRWVAPDEIGREFRFALTAEDGQGAATTQTWTVSVAEATAAPGDRWSRDRALRGSCGCGLGGARGAGPILLALGALALRRRVR